jgi:plasmid maintenance system antidote protein VapI
MQIHIGNIIRDELHRQGHTNQWLADQLSVERSTVQRLFNKPSIDTQQLLCISKVLGKDMFEYYSQAFLDVADIAT